MDRAISTEDQDYGMWTPAFEQPHEAVSSGASPEDIRRHEAVELDEPQGR